ncbi:MAG TPA: metallophosphoesterase family protein [Candidatus Eremiobacteraceae bacterium]|nr:metallophosphoesterase family protein [Candidatus Eremiobacteraceae bacterium]
MRFGIISDIHGNLEALDAVLGEIDAAKIDKLLCLGDVVGYGPNPNECCARLRDWNCVTIAGNHDEAAVSNAGAEFFNPLAREALTWTQEALTPENRSYLESLPRDRHFDEAAAGGLAGGFALVHGAPVFHFDYISDVVDAQRAFERVEVPVTFIGHTHVAEVYYQDLEGRAFQQKLLHGGRIELAPTFRYLINPGSVGQPRDHNPQAAYAILDTADAIVEVRRVGYDVGSVRERMESLRLPAQLGARLAIGY